jgi:thiamine-phosphate pyrophosphorylase
MSGLYAVTPDVQDTSALLARVAAAIDGGTRLLQYRNKVAPRELKLEQARALRSLCSARGCALIVNDDVDVALAIDADGVHVGAGDTQISVARERLGAGALIGVSCYDDMQRAVEAEAAGADYVAFGSFFPSGVKPAAVHAPLELLPRAKRAIGVPIVAIGGITLENATRVLSAGADAIAVISALFCAPNVEAASRAFSNLFEPSA